MLGQLVIGPIGVVDERPPARTSGNYRQNSFWIQVDLFNVLSANVRHRETHMGYGVPSKNDMKDAGKTGGINGTALALGETAGRTLLGRGPGTAIGGLAAAAAEEGTNRDTMSIIAVERAVNELTGGA